MKPIASVPVETATPTIRQDPGSERAWREDHSIQGIRMAVQQVKRGERFERGRISEERDTVGIAPRSVQVVARSGNQKPDSAGVTSDGIEGTVAAGPVQGLGAVATGPGSNAFTLALVAVAGALAIYAFRK
jgi:hypothetical protein